MNILALDMAMRTGWAFGPAGAKPHSGAIKLRKSSDLPLHVASNNIFHALRDRRILDQIDLVVYEAPLDPQVKFQMASDGRNAQNSASIILPWMLVTAVELFCHLYGYRAETSNRQQVLKHFTGRARWGNRDAAKKAVIDRCHLLGLLPKDCKDDDRADAIAIHDYASQRWGKAAPRELVMFGERA